MVDAPGGWVKRGTPHVSRQLSSVPPPLSPQFSLSSSLSGRVGLAALPRYNNTATVHHSTTLTTSLRSALTTITIKILTCATRYTSLQLVRKQIVLRIALDTNDTPRLNRPNSINPSYHNHNRNNVLHPPQAQQPLPLRDPRADLVQRDHNPRQRPRICHAADGRERRGAAVWRDGGELEG